MDAAIDFILKKMMGTIKELFDEDDEFVEFRRDEHSGTRCGTNSQSVSGKIVYRRGGGGGDQELRFSQPLFLKIGADVPSFETANLIFYINEVYFYSRIGPLFEALRPLDKLLPTFYISHLDVSNRATNEIVVLKDLEPDGFVGYRLKRTSMDYEHLALMMRKLGQLHAYSHKARLWDNEKFRLTTNSLKDVFAVLAKELGPRIGLRWKMALEPLRQEQRYAEAVGRCDRIFSDFESYVNESLLAAADDEANSVLCHGSFSKDNVLFRYVAEKPVDLVIIDWQTCQMNYPGLDILLSLYTNASQETRDKHWDSLLDEYQRSMSQTFPEIGMPSVDQISENLRKMKLGLVLMVVGSRIPHHLFAAHGKIQFLKTESFDEYADPLTYVLKDMIDRKFLE